MSSGYPYVNLSRYGKQTPLRIHRLVAMAFLGAPADDGMEVNHKDADRTNNHLANLEWVTHLENVRHSIRLRSAMC